MKQFEISFALSVDLNYKRGRQILHAVKKIIPQWVKNIFEFEYRQIFVRSSSFFQNMGKTCCVQRLSECQKQFLYTKWSPQILALNFHVLNLLFNEQSVVILWVSWCRNKNFWQRFTCKKKSWNLNLFLLLVSRALI